MATDSSREMIDIARKQSSPSLRSPIFAQADVSGSFAKDDRFDAVLAFNLLHLLPDLPSALSEIRSGLVPGGLFISKTPGLLARKMLLRPVVGALNLVGKAPKVAFLSAADLGAALETAGFAVLESGDYPSGTTPSHLIVARLRA